MKKIYALLLSLAWLTATAAAQSTPSQDYFQKRIHDAGQQSLHKRDGLPVLSWQQFKKDAQKEVSFSKTLNSTKFSITEHARFVQSVQTQPLNWAEMLGNEKFLFLGETISGTPSTLQAVQDALHTLREQFPDKHILLATDFVQNTRLDMPTLRKAGQSSELLQRYPLFSIADAENVDILALDDHIFAVEKGTPILKVGPQYIEFYEVAPEKKNELVNTIQGKSTEGMNFLLLMEQLMKSSIYGIVKNNIQWTERIRSLRNNYDLIVVYTSTNHLLTERTSLANNLKARTAPTVILIPSITQIPLAEQKLHTDLLWLLNDLQFGEEQRELQKKSSEMKDKQSQDIFSYQWLRLQNDEVDLQANAHLLRSVHAQEAFLLQNPSQMAISDEQVLRIFTQPFCIELYPSAFVISWLYSQLTPQQQQENQALLLPAVHEDVKEGRIFFYHVGNATQAEYVTQQNGISTAE